jgi:predicted ATP-grasp superfamily ATP-dependent carboligase
MSRSVPASDDRTVLHGSDGRSVAVLLAGPDDLGTLAAGRALHEAGCRVLLATDRSRYAARSVAVAEVQHAPDPGGDPTGFARTSAEVAADRGVDVVLPTTEAALVALARSEQPFPGSTVVACGDPRRLDRLLDKQHVADVARAVGIAVPPRLRLGADDEPPPHTLIDRFPVLVKPPRSDLDQGDGRLVHHPARLATEPGELTEALLRLPDGRGDVEPFLDGELLGYSGIHHRGQILDLVAVRAQRTWPRRCGQFSLAHTVPADPDLVAGLSRLLTALQWDGLFQVDLVRHRDQFHLLDLNPRIYASLGLALAAGRNQMATWVGRLLGLEVGDPGLTTYELGVGYRVTHRDLAAAYTEGGLRSGWAAWRATGGGRVQDAIAVRGDRRPVLGLIGDLAPAGRLRRWMASGR